LDVSFKNVRSSINEMRGGALVCHLKYFIICALFAVTGGLAMTVQAAPVDYRMTPGAPTSQFRPGAPDAI
jgi:hypothetical protein